MTVSRFLCLLTCLSVACGDVCVFPRADGDEFFSRQPQGVDEELCNGIDGECISLNVSDISVLPGYNASVTCPACKCINNGSFHPSTLQCSPPVQCSSSVGFEPFQATGRLPTSQAQQHIVVNKTFSCYGRVTAWKMRISNPDSDKWTLMQVWRRVGEYFQQVGANRINITQTNTSGFTDVVYSVDESEQILYRPGDFIGVFSVNGARALPYAIDLFSPNPLSSFVFSYRLIQSDYAPTQLAVNSIAMGIIPGVLANVAALTGPPLNTDVECIREIFTPPTLSNTVASENFTSHNATEPGIQTTTITAFLGLIIACGTAFLLLVFLTCTGVILLSVCCVRKRKNTQSSRHEDYQNVIETSVASFPGSSQLSTTCSSIFRPHSIWKQSYNYWKTTLPRSPLNSCSQDSEHIYDTIPANTPHFYGVLEGPTLESEYHGLEDDGEGDEDACDKLQNCQDVFERNDSMKPRKETWVGPTDIENTTDTGTNVKEESGNFSEDVTVRDQSENDFDEDYISDFEA